MLYERSEMRMGLLKTADSCGNCCSVVASESVIDYLATGELNPEDQPGAVAYLLLDLVYKLDFLLIPEGYTMEALERMHRMYFAREDGQPVTYKNVRLLSELNTYCVARPSPLPRSSTPESPPSASRSLPTTTASRL